MKFLQFALLAMLAQVPAVQQSPTAAAGSTGTTGTIEGRVVTVEKKEAVSDVAIELRRANGDNTVLYATATGGTGTFAFRNVQPGAYRLFAVRAGFVRAEYGQHSPSGRGLTIDLGPDQRKTDLEISLTLTASISGRVVDDAGRPVVKAQVQALRPSYRNGQRTLVSTQSAFTDDRGEYRLFWLTPGQYYVGVLAPNWNIFPDQLFVSNDPNLPVRTDSASGLGGGAPPPGPLAPLKSPASAAAPTDRYLPVYFPHTPDDQMAQTVDLHAGTALNGINIVLSPVRTRHVRGVVIDEATGQPVAWPPGRVSAIRVVPALANVNTAPNPSNSKFDLQLLQSPTILSTVFENRSGNVTIPVGENDIDGVELVVRAGANVLGQVYVEGAESGTADPRLAALRFTLRGNPQILVTQASPESVVTSATGAFTIENASPGDYRINVSPILILPGAQAAAIPPALQNAYVKSIRYGAIDVLNDGLQINRPLDATLKLQVVIGANAGSIGGIAVDENSKPLAAVTVVLTPDAGHRARTDLYKNVTTDASGHFQIDRIPPGEYKVFAWDDVEPGIWQDPAFMRRYEDRGRPIRIGDGVNEEIQLAVIPAYEN